jgi:hypothetical protein
MSKQKYQCRLLPEQDHGLWDGLIEKSERGAVFHQTFWLKSFGRLVDVIGCYEAGEFAGGMSLCYQQIAGLKIVRPPYLTPYLGPVVFKTGGRRHRVLTLEKDIASSLIDYVTNHYDFVRMPLSLNCTDAQPFQQNGFTVDIEYTYVIDLDDMDRVWKDLNQDRRRKIRKGYDEGLSCELSDDLDEFFHLWVHSLASHDKHLSQSRFGEVRNWYGMLAAKNRAKLLKIRDPLGRVCAGAILVWDHRRAYYLLSGMNRDIASGNSMALLIWECMRFCREEAGIAEFDFDGSDVPGVEVFFRGFGGRLIPRFSVMWGRPLIWPIRQSWKAKAAISQLSARARASFQGHNKG